MLAKKELGMLRMWEAKATATDDLLVMLGMLAGHAGDVQNDAEDVDRNIRTFREKLW